MLKQELISYDFKLQKLGGDIASALSRKNRGKGGFKFIFNVKYYGDFKYSSECSADTDAQGRRIPTVSDGIALQKHAVDVERRDLFNEIDSLSISSLSGFNHVDIVAAEDCLIAEENAKIEADNKAYQRKCADSDILAQKNAEEKKRKRADEAAKAAAALSTVHSDASSELSDNPKKATKVSHKNKNARGNRLDQVEDEEEEADGDEEEEGHFVTDGGFTLAKYTGGENDADNLRRAGRHKPTVTGDLDLFRDAGYEDLDDSIVQSLRHGDAQTLKNYVLKLGHVDVEALIKGSRKSRVSSNKDDEWSESPKIKTKEKSQLDDLDLDKCEGASKGKYYLESNDIDIAPSSDDEDVALRGARGARGTKKPRKGQDVRRAAVAKKLSSSKAKAKFRGGDSNSDSDYNSLLRSSSDSDAPKKKRSAVPKGEDGDEKQRKPREIVALTEQQVTQYGNLNLVPCHLTAAQLMSSDRFEVDGKMMSEDEIKTLIIKDANLISKDIDAKFLTFIREHIMVEVFKDVYFLSNVIEFYRMKRHLHNTQPGDHIICVWQTVLSQVATDLLNELVASNKKILEEMEKNLLDLKESRKQKRRQSSQFISSEKEREQMLLDLHDLQEYREQMKKSKKALEEIEKVMKRRINSFAHSTGAKIACIWAKLNNMQHLLSGNMSRFQKKFLLDPSMPFFSVLSDDLSRKWGHLATSPNGLFSGINLSGSNRCDAAILVDEQGDGSSRTLSAWQSPSSPSILSTELSHLRPSHQETTLDLSSVQFQNANQNSSDFCATMDTNDDQCSEDHSSPPTITEQSSVSHIESVSHEFASPANGGNASVDRGNTAMIPSRPPKAAYTSALLSGSQSSFSPQSTASSPPNRVDDFVASSRNSNSTFRTPAATVTATTSRYERSSMGGSSYLSSISSCSSSNAGRSSAAVSNAAVLFDELKHMSQDSRSVESMKRFIEVMNEKPPNSKMPATKADEEKILEKAKAKKEKTSDTSKSATINSVTTTSVAKDNEKDINLSSDDEMMVAQGDAAVRVQTDSYSYFQKLFVFICSKHVEVKDSVMNLQFFGHRLVKTLKNSVLLRFLSLLLRNREKSNEHLTVYLLHDKLLCSEFKVVFGIAYKSFDYWNILGDGYCVLRSMFALFCNERLGYKLSAAELRAADAMLFKTSKSRREFYEFLSSTRDSIGAHCDDQSTKTADKKKLRTVMTLFAAYPQLKQIPGAYWACLDWAAYAPFNCTAFSTNYSDCVTGYAQLHCSSTVRRDLSSNTIGLVPYSLDDVHRILTEPVSPNFCVLEGQHAFVVTNPGKEEAIESFRSLVGLFMSSCVQNIEKLDAYSVSDFNSIDPILVKMTEDNSYTFDAPELLIMNEILKCLEESVAEGGVEPVVICLDAGVVPGITRDVFISSRENGEVIDLCDSDTGDVDRTHVRAERAKLERSKREMADIKFQVFAAFFRTYIFF